MLRVPILRCAAEVACSVGVVTASSKLTKMFIGDVGLHTRPTAESWSFDTLLAGVEDRRRYALAQMGSSVLAVTTYAIFARTAKLANTDTIVTKIKKPEWRAATLMGLFCLNYTTAKLAFNVQHMKENLRMESAPQHPTQQIIARVFDDKLSHRERSKELSVTNSVSDVLIQPIVEGVLVHKYLFLRLLPMAGPVVATAGTAVAYAFVHRGAGQPWNAHSLALDMADSVVLQSIFMMTGGSAVLPIMGHLLANVFGAGVSASERSLFDRVEESFLWRLGLSLCDKKGLYWYSCVVPRVPDDAIALNLMPPVPRNSHIGNPADAVRSVAARLFHSYKQPGATKLSVEDVADLIYGFRTGSHAIQLSKFKRLQRQGFCVVGIGLPRSKHLYRAAYPSLLCSDQAYLEAARRYPDGMDVSGLTSFLHSEMLVGSDYLTTKKWSTFVTMQDLGFLCSPKGNLCRWSNPRVEDDEDEAIHLVDEYYKSIRADLLDLSSVHIRRMNSPLVPGACQMPNIESILEGLSRDPSGATCLSTQTDEAYYSDTLNIYARRSALSHLQKHGYTIRRWRIVMETLEQRYPDTIPQLRSQWHQYFRSPEFKHVMMHEEMGENSSK